PRTPRRGYVRSPPSTEHTCPSPHWCVNSVGPTKTSRARRCSRLTLPAVRFRPGPVRLVEPDRHGRATTEVDPHPATTPESEAFGPPVRPPGHRRPPGRPPAAGTTAGSPPARRRWPPGPPPRR